MKDLARQRAEVEVASARGRIEAPAGTGEPTTRTDVVVGLVGGIGEVRRIEAALRLSNAITGHPLGLFTLDAGLVVG